MERAMAGERELFTTGESKREGGCVKAGVHRRYNGALLTRATPRGERVENLNLA
jgi:hypothetical protein